MWYMDANSSFGKVEDEIGNLGLVQSPVLGPHGRGKENVNGTSMREFFEHWNMCLPFTFADMSPTFSSGTNIGRNTYIDHIGLSQAVYAGVSVRAHVWLHSGRRLQLVRALGAWGPWAFSLALTGR